MGDRAEAGHFDMGCGTPSGTYTGTPKAPLSLPLTLIGITDVIGFVLPFVTCLPLPLSSFTAICCVHTFWLLRISSCNSAALWQVASASSAGHLCC